MHIFVQSKDGGEFEKCSPKYENFKFLATNVFMVLIFVQSRKVRNNLEENKYKWCKVMGTSLFETKMKQLYAQIDTEYYARMTVKRTVSKNVTSVPILVPTHYTFRQFISKRKQHIGQRTFLRTSFLKPAGLRKVVHRTKSFHFKHHWQCTCYIQHVCYTFFFLQKDSKTSKNK